MLIPLRTKKSRDGLEGFCRFITKRHGSNLTILEVGSWAGSSALIFAKYFKQVTCVDPWEETQGTISASYDMKEVEDLFDHNVQYMENVIKIKGRIESLIDKINMYDIIYIDGEHTYEAVHRDIELCLPKCKLAITGHDYWPGKFDGVIKAVNEWVGKPDRLFQDTSWYKELK